MDDVNVIIKIKSCDSHGDERSPTGTGFFVNEKLVVWRKNSADSPQWSAVYAVRTQLELMAGYVVDAILDREPLDDRDQ